jgi:hypothetical protein
VREYRSADIPMTLVADLADKNGKVIAEEGQVLGHSLATTNWANFVKLVKALKEQGLDRVPVRVMLSAEPRSNQHGNKWGVIRFELIGAAD